MGCTTSSPKAEDNVPAPEPVVDHERTAPREVKTEMEMEGTSDRILKKAIENGRSPTEKIKLLDHLMEEFEIHEKIQNKTRLSLQEHLLEEEKMDDLTKAENEKLRKRMSLQEILSEYEDDATDERPHIQHALTMPPLRTPSMHENKEEVERRRLSRASSMRRASTIRSHWQDEEERKGTRTTAVGAFSQRQLSMKQQQEQLLLLRKQDEERKRRQLELAEKERLEIEREEDNMERLRQERRRQSQLANGSSSETLKPVLSNGGGGVDASRNGNGGTHGGVEHPKSENGNGHAGPQEQKQQQALQHAEANGANMNGESVTSLANGHMTKVVSPEQTQTNTGAASNAPKTVHFQEFDYNRKLSVDAILSQQQAAESGRVVSQNGSGKKVDSAVLALPKTASPSLTQPAPRPRSTADLQAELLKLADGNNCRESYPQGQGITPRLAELLVHEEIDVNHGDSTGNSALHRAAARGNLDTVKLLLNSEGIDVNKKSRYGLTPLMLSARIGHAKCVDVLLSRAEIDIDTADNEGNTALIWTVMESEVECMDLILNSDKGNMINVNARDNDGNVPLHLAAFNGSETILKTLLSRPGVDVNAINSLNGGSALHYAAANGHEKCVDLFLAREGIQVNVKNTTSGDTPLHLASRFGRAACVKRLLSDHRINRSVANKDGQTAHMLASVDAVRQIFKEVSLPPLDMNRR